MLPSENMQQLQNYSQFDVVRYMDASAGKDLVLSLYNQWLKFSAHRLRDLLPHIVTADRQYRYAVENLATADDDTIKSIVRAPDVMSWLNIHEFAYAGNKVCDLEGQAISLEPSYILEIAKRLDNSHIQLPITSDPFPDTWIKKPFGNMIDFLTPEKIQNAQSAIRKAFDIIQEFSQALYDEILVLSPLIKLIVDPAAHPEKVVSFSDNLVPGCLFIGAYLGNGNPVDPFDIADSIIHEHRHQKLYILESFFPVVLEESSQKNAYSPFRSESRPLTGLFHAAYVFDRLLAFWMFVAERNLHSNPEKVSFNLQDMAEKLGKTLENIPISDLTEEGQLILSQMKTTLKTTKSHPFFQKNVSIWSH